MDDGRIEKMIRTRERGYIWLEQELKGNIMVSTAIIAVFFLIMGFLGMELLYCVFLFTVAFLVNAIWCYLVYRREYENYGTIVRYLEEFEMGNYEYHAGNEDVETGIRSQITEQLERMGNAFGTLKNRLVEEKENTKELVTDISHQLKTPVAALGICIELLEDMKITEEEKREFLSRCKKEIEKLNYLMGTLMNLSRLEADMIQICPQNAGLKETLIRAVNGVYLKASEKNIEIEMAEMKEIFLPHDVRWTAEAVSNVLDNAVKYSPQGSKILIRVEPQVSYVFIEIEDEGIGISKEEYPNIFKRFYRGKRPEVEQQEGAGVGLYLVRQIFEDQGGSVRAVSKCGQGTIIQMMLPKKYALEK